MVSAAGAAKVFREGNEWGAASPVARSGSPPALYARLRADCQCGKLIDRIAASAPVRKLLFVEALRHTRVPFAGYRPDHRAGVELATIDAHRAAEAATDLECRLDDGVARQARRDRFEIRDFAGRAAAGHSVPPRSVRVRCAKFSTSMWDETVLPARVLPVEKGIDP